LLSSAERYFAVGNHDVAAALARLAACYAFPANTALFGSARLERLLVQLGKHVLTDATLNPKVQGDKKRIVLHVLSYAKPIGGDSRFVWRWIQQDQSSRHSVVITSQNDVEGTYAIPSVLNEAVLSSGGNVHRLQAPTSKPMQSARELRTLCRQADVVVLHVYPYDIVPVLALAADCGDVKTLYVNHSDHTFWVGSSVAHSIAHLRNQDPKFLQRRRGLNLKAASMLPIPLGPYKPKLREDARRALGYDPQDIVLLTVASPFKYSSPGQVGLLELVLPVVIQYPRVRLLAVGPANAGAWQAASTETQGRIVPMGRRWENEILYAAADIYLDSVPFSSITSLLEAGMCGVPLVGFALPDPELTLLGAGAPGLEGEMFVANSPEAYRKLLRRLIEDADLRRYRGARTRDRILSIHGDSNWLEHVQGAYATLERNSRRGCLEEIDERFETNLLSQALSQLFEQMQGRPRVRQLISDHIGSLPYSSRLLVTWELYRYGLGLCYRTLLPPPLDSIARRIGPRAKLLFQSWSQGGRAFAPRRASTSAK
jgi:glycosyltransferase involved in cell wall biosynthesis